MPRTPVRVAYNGAGRPTLAQPSQLVREAFLAAFKRSQDKWYPVVVNGVAGNSGPRHDQLRAHKVKVFVELLAPGIVSHLLSSQENVFCLGNSAPVCLVASGVRVEVERKPSVAVPHLLIGATGHQPENSPGLGFIHAL